MSDNGRHRVSDSRFRWLVVAGLFALVMILGTIQELAR